MIRIRLPRRRIPIISLVAPCGPSLARAAPEQFDKRPPRARLDNVVLLIRLARMLALARRQQIHLPPSRRQRPGILAADPEQDQFGDVAEVEADAAAVGAAVFPYLVPDDVGLVGKS